ncbi:hypothetical protein J3D55_003406 [Chryseobacterium ginsenosidimutans]|uniref:phage tail protein n=1 Tax=Chryseobacterium ginsenosidimutans TaxID=687846 RepID=UPI002167817B|nr:hypothetical protein [Chryseobacterium ginsenosidimutans]MCS3870490.1 hypothetical protein [Chryseobacterium ginsenosidimutans]
MKAAKPVEKDNKNHQNQSKNQKAKKPMVVPLPMVEATNMQTQKPEESVVNAGFANANANKINQNGSISPVHGSQTVYDQGAEIMYGKLQESLSQTGDINHPDTKKMEKGYMTTLNIDQVNDYQNLKSGTYQPKTLQEQAAMAQSAKSNSESASQEIPTPVALNEVQPVQDSTATSDASEGLVLPVEQEDAAVRTTPTDPHSDPQFNQTVDLVKNTAKAKRTHTTKDKAETQANAAAAIPSGERKSKARGQQVEKLDQQKTNPFKASDFKAKLTSKINKMKLPTNEKEVENFEAHNNIAQVNQSAGADVVASKNSVTGGIETVAKQEPNEAKIQPRVATALPDPKIGSKVNIKAIVPGKRGDAELSTPITQGYKAVEQQFEKNNITDEQLASSNEPTFINALNAKKAAKENAENTPGAFKAAESKKLESSKQDAQGKTNSTMEGMHHSRKEMLDGVTQKQHKAGEKNTGKHQDVVAQLNQIYADTKKSVDGELNDLETKVTQLFDAGAKVAKDAFEKYVTKKTDDYKEKRYGSWYDVRGYGKRLKDGWNGKLPDEVNVFFTEGRKLFLVKLDATIDAIAKLVTDRLNRAKTAITSGRQKVTAFIKNLPADVKKAIKGDIDAIQGQFKQLEKSISAKESSLIDSLVTKYNNTLKEVDEMVDEFKKRNQGFLSALKDATLGVWETIQNIKKTLTDILSGALDVILSIITHPIDFLSNLIDGVSQGFTNFGNNIWTHLKTGFFGWLTGASKGVSVIIPEDAFSLKGIFSITMQVLDLTWGGIRSIGAKVIGEPVMKVLETGFEMVQVVRKEGVAGLWEHLKDQFADLKETVMDAIMDIVQTQVIQAGIKWIMGLLTPVGAFIKAAMAIIDVVKFFIQRAAQIMELVKAFTESIKAIASGNVGAVAKSIENALGRAIPVLIGFLASLLGISGLADKVVGVIRKIRERIVKAITKFWNFVKSKAKGLIGKVGVGKKDKKEKKTKDERTTAEKERDLRGGLNAAKEYAKKTQDAEKIRKKLPKIEEQYDMKSLKMVVDNQNENAKTIHFEGEVNPKGQTEKIDIKAESFGEIAVGKHPLKGKDRQSHHVPENKFMERVKEFYGNIGKKLNGNEDFKDVANKLLQREADIEINFKNGKNLSAILLYKTTHIHSDKAVHSVELQADATDSVEKQATRNKELVFMGYDEGRETKRAQMREEHWDNFIKDVYLFLQHKNINVEDFVKNNKDSYVIKVPGNNAGVLNIISDDIADQIQKLFNKFAGKEMPKSQLLRQKNKILEQINMTVNKSYQGALLSGIETVATALSKSDDDGDKSEHPQAIEHLKIIAGQIWRNHIVKPIEL